MSFSNEKALSLVSRTTDRERMMIEAHYALNRDHENEADRLVGAYLERYPDDATMRFDYANLLRTHKRETEAIEQYNQVLRIMPDYTQAYIGIATAYKTQGKYAGALQAYAKAFELDPHWLAAGNISREYGFTLVANGESDKAQEVFTGLLANPATRESAMRSLAFLDLYRGQYKSAKSRLQQSQELLGERASPLSVARIHLALAVVADGQGDSAEEKRQLDAAEADPKDIQEKVDFGAMVGDAYARAGNAEQAQKIAAMIEPLEDKNNSEQAARVDLLKGDIASLAGQRDAAIASFAEADKANSTGYTIEAVAYGYQQAGDIDHAIASYEFLLAAPEPALGWEPQQRCVEARYTLATDYAARGNTQKARQTLEALLKLWKDADPDLPLLKRAKAEYAKVQ